MHINYKISKSESYNKDSSLHRQVDEIERGSWTVGEGLQDLTIAGGRQGRGLKISPVGGRQVRRRRTSLGW
jgi:hypothetical protein